MSSKRNKLFNLKTHKRNAVESLSSDSEKQPIKQAYMMEEEEKDCQIEMDIDHQESHLRSNQHTPQQQIMAPSGSDTESKEQAIDAGMNPISPSGSTTNATHHHSFWRNKSSKNSIAYSTRLIERGSGSHPNVIIRGHVHSYLYLYHSIIDTPWTKLFLYGFLLFFVFNLFFGTIFHLISGVTWNGSPDDDVTWGDSFFFALQSMDTIGYGALIPSNSGGNWLVFLQSYAASIFWTAFTGIVFAKLSRPSRLKRQFKFSDVAVINHEMECFVPEFFDDPESAQQFAELDGIRWSEYGHYAVDEVYPCLQFRFGDMRHTSRICDSDFHLIFFQRTTRNDSSNGHTRYEDYSMEEMDFDINRQRGRPRSMGPSVPLLSLPWYVVHKIDKLSPLYGLTREDMLHRKCEIIAIVDGIDEATSDNFQSWWSFTANEIYWDYKFRPMVRSVIKSHKQFLQIDYDRISLVRPIGANQSNQSTKKRKSKKTKGSKSTNVSKK